MVSKLQPPGVKRRTAGLTPSAFSAADWRTMERWHATTSSDTSANHVGHLLHERFIHAPFPRRRQYLGMARARTPNLTTTPQTARLNRRRDFRERARVCVKYRAVLMLCFTGSFVIVQPNTLFWFTLSSCSVAVVVSLSFFDTSPVVRSRNYRPIGKFEYLNVLLLYTRQYNIHYLK